MDHLAVSSLGCFGAPMIGCVGQVVPMILSTRRHPQLDTEPTDQTALVKTSFLFFFESVQKLVFYLVFLLFVLPANKISGKKWFQLESV